MHHCSCALPFGVSYIRRLLSKVHVVCASLYLEALLYSGCPLLEVCEPQLIPPLPPPPSPDPLNTQGSQLDVSIPIPRHWDIPGHKVAQSCMETAWPLTHHMWASLCQHTGPQAAKGWAQLSHQTIHWGWD